ncbi:MAG: hypothetical protein ABMA13_12020 [Chthoniobacteraceae bacterium]
MLLRLVASLLLITLASANACSVPVFRYALEHWAADPFEALVFHRGPLTPEQRALADKLSADAGKMRANLTVRTIDLDREPLPDAPGQLPSLSVRFPGARGATFWSGPLAENSVERLVDSPARREVARRLGEGESAVWLLIESGDRAKDDAAATTLQARLDYLVGTLELPKLEAQDIANGLVSIAQEDLRLDFSILRLRRDDSDEGAFIKMLLTAETDLDEAKEPIVFPVFGRGRALYALVGEGIKRETIDRAASFLIGKCSCEVKDQNPGIDLLFATDWDGLVKAKSVAAPDLPTLAQLTAAAPVSVTISGADVPLPAKTPSFPTAAALAVGALVLLLGVAALRRIRGK